MDELSKSRSHYCRSHLGRLSFAHHQVKKYYFKDSTCQDPRQTGKDSIQLKMRIGRCVIELSFFLDDYLFIYKFGGSKRENG